MTDIEQKALALVNEVRINPSYPYSRLSEVSSKLAINALCHAIEQHEAFRQDVSDAAEHLCRFYGVPIVMQQLERFIIPKPVDPLVDALVETFPRANGAEMMAQDLRAAMLARGYEFTKINKEQNQ